MIMYAFVMKSVLPLLAFAGLIASFDIQPGLLQLGVAGASIGALVVHFKYAAKQNQSLIDSNSENLKRVMDGHTSSTDKICDRIDTLVKFALGVKDEEGKKQ